MTKPFGSLSRRWNNEKRVSLRRDRNSALSRIKMDGRHDYSTPFRKRFLSLTIPGLAAAAERDLVLLLLLELNKIMETVQRGCCLKAVRARQLKSGNFVRSTRVRNRIAASVELVTLDARCSLYVVWVSDIGHYEP